MPETPHQPATSQGTTRLLYMTLGTIALILVVVLASRIFADPGVAGTGSSIPLWALLPVAYLGGVLALLSPCSGAILPAFFAYSFDTKGDMVRMTYVFYLGLALVFVPLFGASAFVGNFILDNSTTIFVIGGSLLIAFGVVALFGFDLGSLTAKLGFEPSTVGQQQVAQAKTEEGKVYAMGAVFGFATSSCTAPIVSGLIALSVTSGLSALAGVVMFLVFALGIVTPLFVLSVLFEDSEVAKKVTGATPKTLKLGRWEHSFHPVHLASGIALILLGIIFIVFRGTLELTHYYQEIGLSDLYNDWNLAVQQFFETTAGQAVAVLLLLALAGLGYLLYRRITAPGHAR